MAQKTCTDFCKEKLYNTNSLIMLNMFRQLLVPKNELDETPNGKSSENHLRVIAVGKSKYRATTINTILLRYNNQLLVTSTKYTWPVGYMGRA